MSARCQVGRHVADVDDLETVVELVEDRRGLAVVTVRACGCCREYLEQARRITWCRELRARAEAHA